MDFSRVGERDLRGSSFVSAGSGVGSGDLGGSTVGERELNRSASGPGLDWGESDARSSDVGRSEAAGDGDRSASSSGSEVDVDSGTSHRTARNAVSRTSN